MDRRRLLIASPFANFLAELLAPLTPGFEINRANSEDVALFLGKEWSPQLIILDGDSPLFNSIIRIRSKLPHATTGLIVVTRELTVAREERALRSGCDLIVQYPTSAEVFALRVQALANRIAQWPTVMAVAPSSSGDGSTQPTAQPITFGEVTILPRDHAIRRGDQLIPMTPIQFKLLMMFLNHREQLLSRQRIKDTIWQDTEISLRSIDAQISKLRKVMPEIDPHLINIYGKGYVFTENRRAAA